MSGKIRTFLVVGIVGLIAVWYLFRPELLFIDQTVNEELPGIKDSESEQFSLLLEGQFRGIAHETKGSALIYELPDGKHILRLMDFETSNGPDVHVYLVAIADAPNDATVKEAEIIDLGTIKGNIGDQNYELPEDLDLEKFRSVTIWCKRFGVNFGTASLSL